MKLAVFLPNWIGDVVMATPTLRAVRDQFPEAEIVGIMRPYVADVLAGTGLLDRTLFYNPRGKQASDRGLAFVRRLRAERFETVLLLPNSLRSAWLAWLSGARRRIGFARDLRGWLLTERVTPKPKSTPHPVLDEYLRLAERLGCDTSSRRIELAVLAEDQSRLDEFWKSRETRVESQEPEAVASSISKLSLALSSRLSTLDSSQALSSRPSTLDSSLALDSRYICLNTGGAFGAAKNWPRESFVELARRVVSELNRRVLVVCGPSEREDARWIAATADHPAISSLADVPLSIGLTKAAIRQADLLVTTDSGPRHFAAAFGTPVITLFGPTHIAWSETHYERAEHLQHKLPCGPCQQRECPLRAPNDHHRCMKDLSVETVFQTVARTLKQHPSRKVA